MCKLVFTQVDSQRMITNGEKFVQLSWPLRKHGTALTGDVGMQGSCLVCVSG